MQQGRYSTEEVIVCGSQRAREISLKVDGTAVEITFKSDLNVNERGFKITYQAYGMFHGRHHKGPGKARRNLLPKGVLSETGRGPPTSL